MRKIAFKIAFSANLGSGHLYRCSRLAQKLKKRGVITYFLINRELKKKFLNLIKYFDHCVFKKNFRSEIDFLKSKNINSIIIDNPKLSLKKQKKYKIYLKKLFIYQDIPTKNFADVIINHNYIKNSLKVYKNISRKNCTFLLGPKFYLMETYKSSVNKKKVISIFLGGNTPRILLEKIIKILISIRLESFKVIIFSGVFNKNFFYLKKKFPQIKLQFRTQENYKKLFKVISDSKFFFCCGGSTLIEAIFLKTPIIAFSRTKNQLNNCLNFSKEKLIFYGGKKINELAIKKFINTLLNQDLVYNKLLNNLDLFKKKNFKNNLDEFILKKIE
jgi:spore coat polysaccharide biosynthesis predicted glycosyltransferase SpsG